MWLVKSGVPFDVAFGCESYFRLASVIVMAGFEGNEWDWNERRFKRKS